MTLGRVILYDGSPVDYVTVVEADRNVDPHGDDLIIHVQREYMRYM